MPESKGLTIPVGVVVHARRLYGNECRECFKPWPCPDAVQATLSTEATQTQIEIADHFRVILELLGLDSESQHFALTPMRAAKVLLAYRQPLDLKAVLKEGFEEDDLGDEASNEKTLVVQTNIPFMGLCAHHLLPFFGSAAVGYLPRDRVVGLSKLARLVYAAGHLAPTTQEDITNKVADALFDNPSINPKGVAVLTSGLHGCMSVRGVESPSTRTIASAIRGDAFRDNPALETKFMALAVPGLGLASQA